MTNPNYQKAIVFLKRANAAENGLTVLRNEQTTMDGLQPFILGSGAAYGPVTSDANNPTYCPSFRPFIQAEPMFQNLPIFGPQGDVVTLFVGGNYNPTSGQDTKIECGVGLMTEEISGTYARTLFNANTTPDTMSIMITASRDNPTPDSNHYATAGLFSNSLAAEIAAGFGGASCTLANAPDFFYGVVNGTSGSLAGQSAVLTWKPWAGLGLTAPTNGTTQWICTRYHKYDPAFPNRQKISVFASWDNTVRTLTFYTYGSQTGTGVMCPGPRNHFYNLRAEMTVAYDIASETTTWDSAFLAQALQWAAKSPDDTSVTSYLSQLQGWYVRNTGPIIDQSSAFYNVQGKLVPNGDVAIVLPSSATLAQNLNVNGGWPSDNGSLAGCWLQSADGTVNVPQYIRNWGWGAAIRNYRNLTTAGFSSRYTGCVRFQLTMGSITDLRGCSFVFKDPTGAVVYTVPIAPASYVGDVVSYYFGNIFEILPQQIAMADTTFTVGAMSYINATCSMLVTTPTAGQPLDSAFDASSEKQSVTAHQQFNMQHTSASVGTNYRTWLQLVDSAGNRTTVSVLTATNGATSVQPLNVSLTRLSSTDATFGFPTGSDTLGVRFHVSPAWCQAMLGIPAANFAALPLNTEVPFQMFFGPMYPGRVPSPV